MDELQTESAERRQGKKQRALNALVFLLATAFCVQAYVLWETNEKLSATVAELEHVRDLADNAEWNVIPKSNPPDAANTTQTTPRSPIYLPQSADPYASLDRRIGLPFSDIHQMRAQLERMMDQMRAQSDIAPQAESIPRIVGAARQLRMNEQAGAYLVKAELTGIDSANVNVRVEDQTLYICVKHEKKVQSADGSGADRQRLAGQCTQRVTMPGPVDGAAMKWSIDDGVLTVVIPKAGRAGAAGNSGLSQSVRN
ncbi:MAG: Hsp20/alpha crystallin family protein [Candidatus Hydrogenedentes bacterium]|nr:Hsp20/alpha crystallin family protein [Candidatus Hydrogenedentota bacterium]